MKITKTLWLKRICSEYNAANLTEMLTQSRADQHFSQVTNQTFLQVFSLWLMTVLVLSRHQFESANCTNTTSRSRQKMDTQEQAICQLMTMSVWYLKKLKIWLKLISLGDQFIRICQSAFGGGPGLVFSPLDDYSLLNQSYRAAFMCWWESPCVGRPTWLLNGVTFLCYPAGKSNPEEKTTNNQERLQLHDLVDSSETSPSYQLL